MKYLLGAICIFFTFNHAWAVHCTDTVNVNQVLVVYKPISTKNANAFFVNYLKSNYNDLALSEYLTKASTLTFKNYGAGGSSTISFRGTNASHTKVLWNGLNIGSSMLGLLDFSTIPSNSSDLIEIQYGGATAAYGTAAMGGVILLNTNNPFANKNTIISFTQTFSSIDAMSSQVYLKFGKKKIRSLLTLNYQNNQNNYSFKNYTQFNSPTQNQINAETKSGGIIHQLYYQVNANSQFSLHTWYQESDRNIGPPIFNRNQTAYQLDHSIRNIASYSTIKNSLHRFKWSLGHNREYIRYVNRVKVGSNNLELLNSKSTFDALNFEFNYAKNLEHRNESWSISSVYEGASIADYGKFQYRFRNALALNEEFLFKRNWTLDFINRLERALNKNLFASQMAFNKKNLLQKDITLRFGIGKNYNLPTLNDLYWQPGGNPNLLAEQGLEANVNLKYQHKSASISLNAYDGIINHWILWQPAAIENGTWTPQNLRQVHLYGLELMANITHQIGSYHFQANYNFSINHAINNKAMSLNDQSVGKQLIYVPINKSNLMLQVNHRSTWLQYGFLYNGFRYTSSDNKQFLPAYLLHDFALGHLFFHQEKQYRILFRIENILNKTVESIPFRPLPGRVYSINLQLNLNK
jgi:iron complex outermembrane receptor protein